MLSLLQVYRGFAAILVALAHAGGAVSEYFGSSPALQFWEFGRAGVQFFFVLSGFIIYYIHHGDFSKPERLLPYAAKRAVRIYPVYILVCLVLAPAWLFVPSFGEPYHKDVGGLVLSLLLVPQDHYPHLGVAWTLIHEVIFYAVFATLIVSVRSGRLVLLLWFSSIVAINILLRHDLPFPAVYFLSINNLLFGLGMLAGYLIVHRPQWLKHGLLIFVLGNLGFLATGLLSNAIPQATEADRVVLAPLFGIASFAIVLQATNGKLDAFFRRRRLLLLLGDASYSIYLIHYPVISLQCKVLQYLGIRPPSLIAFVVVTFFAVVAGVLLHLWVEKPMLEYLRRKVLPRPVTAAAH